MTREALLAKERSARLRSRVFATLDDQWRGTVEFRYAGSRPAVRRALLQLVRDGVAERAPHGAWRRRETPLDGYLHSGIRNLTAAKRSIRDRFNRGVLEPIQRRLGARFYVTARAGGRTALLLGPYASHMVALIHVARGKRLAHEHAGRDAVFASFGTVSLSESRRTVFGR